MDDALELPNAAAFFDKAADNEDAHSSGDEEDGGLDWTKLLSPASRPIIPKRGEKEFEPRAGGGSNLQQHVLDRSRSAMCEALRAQRTISSKAVSYGIWYPEIARVHVTIARGIHFTNMGHSAARIEAGAKKAHKRLELLPEEALYLVERGALFCWKENDSSRDLSDVDGSPMTVQQAFAEMIGKENLSLEKFQVFAILKRLGYIVIRAEAPSPAYPLPSRLSFSSTAPSIMHRIGRIFLAWKGWFSRILFAPFNCWKPLRVCHWLCHNRNYASLFRSLRFIPSGHSIPLTLLPSPTSPYRIFYNLYKPSTSFKKSTPPPPDFQVVVVNARTTPVPRIEELSYLYDALPELPPPQPRRRHSPPVAPTHTPGPSVPSTAAVTSCHNGVCFLQRLFPWAFRSAVVSTTRKPNPYMILKHGKKMVVIAVVDSGNASFFRFSQGEFAEWPMA